MSKRKLNIYVVCWHDPGDGEHNPVYDGRMGMIVVGVDDPEFDQIPLFTSEAAARKFIDGIIDSNEETYVIERIDYENAN